GLRTAASHPPGEGAIGPDEGLGSGVGRGRSLARHHRGKDKWLTSSAPLAGLLEERIPHTRHSPSLCRHAISAQALPDFFRRDGNVDVTYTEVPQGINDSIRNSRRGSHGG